MAVLAAVTKSILENVGVEISRIFRPQVWAAPKGPIALGAFGGSRYPRTCARATTPRHQRREFKWGYFCLAQLSAPPRLSSSTCKLQPVEALLETPGG